MSKNTQSKTKATKTTAKKSNIWDIFKLGESYTSLILGIFAVVIATVLLLTFVKGKNAPKVQEEKKQVAMQNQKKAEITATPEPTKKLLKNEQQKVAKEPTKEPTKIAAKPTEVKKQGVKKDNKQTKNNKTSGNVYTVKEGDTLWKIAEEKYKSGYNWVDIQKTNKLDNPGILTIGTKLTLPNVSPKVATVAKPATEEKTDSKIQTNKISGTSYTIAKGDTLWDIAVRAYGDGYSWTKLASANNLSNPNVIHAGNKITIPREK